MGSLRHTGSPARGHLFDRGVAEIGETLDCIAVETKLLTKLIDV